MSPSKHLDNPHDIPLSRHVLETCPSPAHRPRSRRWKWMETQSTHYLVEIWDADRETLDSVTETRTLLLEAARHAKVTVLHSAFHRFNPVGVSGVVVIAESHISIHTWPEAGYAAADIFTCGDRAMPERAAEYLAEAFGAGEVEVTRLVRGIRHAPATRMPHPHVQDPLEGTVAPSNTAS